MEVFTTIKLCKKCNERLEYSHEEGLECTVCKKYLHIKCLKRGSVPGGLYGDTFFIFTCSECSTSGSECFIRSRLSWLQIIVLVLYHLQNKSPCLARKGFFHWRHHVATFIDKNWNILFPTDLKKKKKWTGTIAGILSHFNKFLFLSGTSVFKEPAFWTLMYPKISPLTIFSVYSIFGTEKQNMKIKKENVISDSELFDKLLNECIKDKDLLKPFNISSIELQSESKESKINDLILEDSNKKTKRKQIKSLGISTKKLIKLSTVNSMLPDDLMDFNLDSNDNEQTYQEYKPDESKPKEETRLLNPYCHYNTSLSNISRMKGLTLLSKLTGGIKQDLILSPYSGLYLKPYIRRDIETIPQWLKLMAEIQLSANVGNKNYKLPPRAPIDYTYVQPEHIPAINSLCNQFFWPGIDLTETLQYPDFSCIVLYKRLVVAFAFLVPDVGHTECYLSFVFTRPCWRNCGIAKFMIYHLIQTSVGKDVTLHVSMNNPVLLLYQKFGFKVEHVVLNFYDKYLRDNVNESKHAFFCRLER